ncbi:MAG: M14 family zinc carboxypeptidase, partial [Bdellovibrionaceae bacterium]|nr:M14 family zinc carboxypeptidase [Pseudobdellovibrionaceae bacterium]
MRKGTTSILFTSVAFLLLGLPQARSVNNEKFILYLRADNKFERSAIADEGIAIEGVRDGMVIAIGDELDREKMERLGFLVSWTPLAQVLDFPAKDAAYHNYDELLSEMRGLESLYPQLVKIESIGRSVQGRQIPVMKISGQLNNEKNLPAIIFLGGHHAREHLSVETCFRIFRDLVHRYGQGDARVMALFDNRVIHVIPAVNPDGLEYDIEGGSYKMWRKNRRLNNNGTYGVDPVSYTHL